MGSARVLSSKPLVILMKRVFLFLLFCISTSAQAECSGGAEELFQCSFDSGYQLNICLQEGAVTYMYGADGKMPELILSRRVEDVTMTPWPGIGRTFWEEINVRNQGVTYTITQWADRNDLNTLPGGAVDVVRNGEHLVRLDCVEGTVTGDFYPLFEAKQNFGQSWCHDAQAWDACG